MTQHERESYNGELTDDLADSIFNSLSSHTDARNFCAFYLFVGGAKLDGLCSFFNIHATLLMVRFIIKGELVYLKHKGTHKEFTHPNIDVIPLKSASERIALYNYGIFYIKDIVQMYDSGFNFKKIKGIGSSSNKVICDFVESLKKGEVG